jgi:SSS family solute:Na+ symporter
MKFCPLIISISLFLCSCKREAKIPDETLRRAKCILYDVLQNGYQWEKVHAAEFLLDLGYNQDICETFHSELASHGTVPEYRIGIWRTLYRASDSTGKERWKDSIYGVFVNPDAPDRIHAAETLAKLKIDKHKKNDDHIIKNTLTTTDLRLWFYTQWWILPQAPNGMEELKKHLFQIICSGEYDHSIRSLAAYVIREDKSLSLNDEEWLSLKNIAISEPGNTGVRPLLLVAALTKVPETFSGSSLLKDIKNSLFKYKDSNSQDLYYFCSACADKGTISDIKILTGLPDDEVNDIRNAASYAVLKINERMNYNK